ncbi:MAG: class I SAM-dependent methyltransferase [Saprospiraceae bacterium]|nr:class I SAM-dependent methyltransferase [Saprospiraceae bacterium]
MQLLDPIIQYLKFYVKADTRFNVHSPYAASLIKAYFRQSNKSPEYLIQIRKELTNDRTLLNIQDYGAGPKRKYSGAVETAKIASMSLSNQLQISRICNLARFVNPDTILELGSAFGVSALHLQSICSETKIFTIEGNPSVAAKAQVIIDDSPFQTKPQLIVGQFHQELPAILRRIDKLDLVFIDGDHTFSGTLNNLNLLLPSVYEKTIILIHDIYWSAEMRAAWRHCKTLPEVTMSLDLFNLGILIFRKSFEVRQHLTIIPYWQKPWRIGLFG